VKQSQDEIAAWVGSHVLPYEADVRARLRRIRLTEDEIDDLIQEAYCRIARLESVAHIQSGRAYLFQAARNVFLQHLHRRRIVRIDGVGEIEALGILDDGPSPERITAGRLELQRVARLIAALPDRCRRIFVLRRIQGVPQRQIARALGISENTVETQCARGLAKILEGLAEDDRQEGSATISKARHDRNRTRNR
jgi:RNA polymerase sigma factor (sigma-70 family)